MTKYTYQALAITASEFAAMPLLIEYRNNNSLLRTDRAEIPITVYDKIMSQ